jgi:hypothetical protein
VLSIAKLLSGQEFWPCLTLVGLTLAGAANGETRRLAPLHQLELFLNVGGSLREKAADGSTIPEGVPGAPALRWEENPLDSLFLGQPHSVSHVSTMLFPESTGFSAPCSTVPWHMLYVSSLRFLKTAAVARTFANVDEGMFGTGVWPDTV